MQAKWEAASRCTIPCRMEKNHTVLLIQTLEAASMSNDSKGNEDAQVEIYQLMVRVEEG